MSAPFAETSRFTTPSGDFCSLVCDAIPFEGITSVQSVFDALLFYFLHMEISISELLGELTIREDDGHGLQGTFQHRIVSDIRESVQVELNCAMFYHMCDASEAYGGGRPFGLIVADTIDEDARFPYSPLSRLRQDVTAAVTVTLQPRKRAATRDHTSRPSGGAGGREGEEGDEEELMVVVTRTCLLNLRRTTVPIPPHVMQALRDSIERWGDAMMAKAREIVYHSHPSASVSAGLSTRQLTDVDVCELLDLDGSADALPHAT